MPPLLRPAAAAAALLLASASLGAAQTTVSSQHIMYQGQQFGAIDLEPAATTVLAPAGNFQAFGSLKMDVTISVVGPDKWGAPSPNPPMLYMSGDGRNPAGPGSADASQAFSKTGQGGDGEMWRVTMDLGASDLPNFSPDLVTFGVAVPGSSSQYVSELNRADFTYTYDKTQVPELVSGTPQQFTVGYRKRIHFQTQNIGSGQSVTFKLGQSSSSATYPGMYLSCSSLLPDFFEPPASSDSNEQYYIDTVTTSSGESIVSYTLSGVTRRPYCSTGKVMLTIFSTATNPSPDASGQVMIVVE